MCWSCNPICGGCRPPRKRAVKCPSCNAFNVFDIEQGMRDKTCASCGVDLTELAVPKPLLCEYCGEFCYNPCKRGKMGLPDGYQACLVRAAMPLIAE